MSKRIVSILTASLLILTVVFTAGSVFAQTTTGTTTPGVPNTGVGDNALNVALLVSSGVIAVLGGIYLSTRKVI